ncbi:hypothetical protein CONLIGDRAFT_632534 [Coniochaeta ligniaria NRRL 30616]|uniref:Uncharacterized protein n=1 Tax=Coniochaeta ligniaria NRRL 30616 TaxID=1408157 RepID=A0A1J7J4R3_9PEZI|nr:hypothetical protein CONLIGDRAFT_632534 [Coniochaeta ligniaria NRRL 30616]
MDLRTTLATLPVEIRQCILEELISLRDLQSAILACRALTAAYYTSRSLIRQTVFLKEYHSLTSGAAKGPVLVSACRRVERLSRNSPTDGLILGEALWPTLLADGELTSTVEFYVWSSDLAEAYRAAGLEDNARAVEVQTWQTIRLTPPPNRQSCWAEAGQDDPRLAWLRRMSAACARHSSHCHGQALLRQAWCDLRGEGWLPTGRIRHKTGHILVTCTADVCRGEDGVADALSRQSTMAEAWDFLRQVAYDRHIDGAFCMICLDAAKTLAGALKGEIELLELERVWREIPPRSYTFRPWSWLFVEGHSVRLDGVLKIWERLREVPDARQFEEYDLEWAREVIQELRKQKHRSEGTKQALTFQASVFALFDPRMHQYYAFGRNLADAYTKTGDFEEAIHVREQMMRNTESSSGVYKSSGLALAHLYRKLGRHGKAEDSEERIEQDLSEHRS